VKNDGESDNYKPFQPVGTLKHFYQYNYNHGKWGVDKSTELADHLSVDGLKLCFESEYILRMVQGIVVSLWRTRQARDIVRPFVARYKEKNDNQLPSITQIRNLCYRKMRLDPFVFRLGIELVKLLQSRRYIESSNPLFANNVQNQNRVNTALGATGVADREFQNAIRERLAKKRWPVLTKKLNTFSDNDTLNRFRRHVSVMFPHNRVANPMVANKKNGSEIMVVSRQKCVLCLKGSTGRKTMYMCDTCKVPLCTRVLRGEAKTAPTHFALWHSCNDLKAERNRCHTALKQSSKATEDDDDEEMGSNPDEATVDDTETEVPALPPFSPNVDVGTSNFDSPPSARHSLSPVAAGLQWSPMVGDGAFDDSDEDSTNEEMKSDTVEEGKREEE
jgi:hypothetical protein